MGVLFNSKMVQSLDRFIFLMMNLLYTCYCLWGAASVCFEVCWGWGLETVKAWEEFELLGVC